MPVSRTDLSRYVGKDVTLFMLRTDGYSRPFRCRLLSITDPRGPVVDWRGERTRLLGWDKLIGVHRAGR
jgi:hypothetical protein